MINLTQFPLPIHRTRACSDLGAIKWTTNETLTWNESHRNHRIIIECAADPQCCVTRYGFPRCWWPQRRRWWPLLLLLLLLLPLAIALCVSFRFLAATHFHIWTIAATSCAATANSHSRPLRSIHVPQQCQPALVPLAVCSRRRRHCQRRAVHSITIICLCRESSLSLSLLAHSLVSSPACVAAAPLASSQLLIEFQIAQFLGADLWPSSVLLQRLKSEIMLFQR